MSTATMSPEVTAQLAQILQEKYGFSTQTELNKAVTEILQKAEEKFSERKGARRNTFSLSTMIRGLRVMKGESLSSATAAADVEYLRALTTGSTPGSYMVPTVQADEIINFLETGGIVRAAGARIWPMNGIQKMNVPIATGTPAWVWMAQNSVQTPTDPNLGQMAFDLKERRALIAAPNQLLAVSVPAYDVLLSEMLGLGGAAHEDTAYFATTTVSAAPVAILSAAGISTLNVGGSANGGNLAYTDILSVLAKAAAVKAAGPFVWFASPRTMYNRIMGLVDLQSRPIYIPTLTQGLQTTGVRVGSVQTPVGMLMGIPVYISPYILENEANGSGTNQSHLIFTNPKYLNIAQDSNIEIAYSLERYFDSAQTAVRAMQHLDFAVAPAAGCIALLGIN